MCPPRLTHPPRERRAAALPRSGVINPREFSACHFLSGAHISVLRLVYVSLHDLLHMSLLALWGRT